MMLASEAAMQAEIIAVGSELLLGQIVDTNLAFIAKEFAAAGLDLYYKIAVVDIRIAAKGADAADASRMIEAVEAEIRQRLGDIVFSVDDDTIEGQITTRLLADGARVAVAELGSAGAVAELLAEAVRKWSGVEIGLATVFEDVPDTTPPVTVVGIAVALAGRRAGREHRLGGDRPSLRIRTATLARVLLRRSLS